MRCARVADTYLLHDSSLSLGEGDVPSRFVLDKLDVNLSPLATGLVVVVVVVVGSGTDARTLDASSIAIAIAGERVVGARALVGIGVLDVGHRTRCSCDQGGVVYFGFKGLGMAE